MLKQRHQLFVVLMRASDAACVLGACLGAWAINADDPVRIMTDPGAALRQSFAIVLVPVVLIAMAMGGLYRPRRDRALFGEIALIVRSSVISVLLCMAIYWMISGTPTGATMLGSALIDEQTIDAHAKAQFAWLLGLIPGALSLERVTLRLTLRAMRRRGWNMRDVAVVGVGRLGQITARTLERNAWTGLRVAYFVSHHGTTDRAVCLGREVKGGLEQLEEIFESAPVDAVYLSVPNAMASRVPEILARLDRFAVDVRLVPDVRPKHLPQSMTVSQLEGMPILSYRETPMAGVGAVLKRVIDIVGSLLAILVFSPVFIVIGALLLLTSDGPVIFRQRRVSLGGEVFRIYKFRTMTQSGSADPDRPCWTTREDPRVTRVGSVLRRTSLDELPQLFNVLLGHMSLVGPRPEREDLIDQFRDDWRGYMLRQHVKAGMTGWAQINGLRGDTSLRKRLQYDLFYIRNWSIWFDLWILMLTPFRGFVHRNAY